MHRTLRFTYQRFDMILRTSPSSFAKVDAAMQDFALACIRIPKSGSSTLTRELESCPTLGQRHRLFTTLDPDARVSLFQRARLARSQVKSTVRSRHGLTMASAYRAINAQIRPGNLITGGHFDVLTILRNVQHKIKFVTLLRNPASRCLSEYNYARDAYLHKHPVMRFDAGLRAKIAARHSFDGYIDFLIEHREAYGNISAQFLGLRSRGDISVFERQSVFHWGTLENHARERLQLHIKLKSPVLPDAIFSNRTMRRSVDSPSPAQMSRLHDLYPLDFEIWEHIGQQERALHQPAAVI